MERDNKELMYTFGKRLKIAMTERGITNKQLAEILNVSKSTIDGYRGKHHNRSLPTISRLVDISKALNFSTDFLLGLEDF